MATPLGPWPDAERVIAEALTGLADNIGRETGTDLQGKLPFIRIRRIGGADDRVTDAARLDIRVYDADATGAKSLSETIRQRLLAGPASTSRGVMDRAFTEVAPQEVPSADPDHYVVFSATYRVSLRRR